MTAAPDVRVDADDLTRGVAAVFTAAGLAPPEAATVARHLVSANLTGHESHGVARVPRYIANLVAGDVRAGRTAIVATDAGAVVVLDGDRGFGQSIGEQAIHIGLDRAGRHGIALVGIRNVGHLGRLGGWAEMAADAGLVSLHFINSPGRRSAQVAPFGSAERRLPPNPLAIGFPRRDGPHFILDITASVIPEGKAMVALNRGTALPIGAAINAAGVPTRDPRAFYGPPPGALLPIGGHKGSGLCMAIDLLAGALTSGGCCDLEGEQFGNNMLSILIDPARADSAAFTERSVSDLAAWVGGAQPVEPGGAVLIPGEAEGRAKQDRLENGIPLDDATWNQIAEAAQQLGAAEAWSSLALRRSQ